MSPNKNRTRDPDRARHMMEAAKLILTFVKGRTFQEFCTDDLLRSAVERQFEILGEASSHISFATQVQWPTIEWKALKSFRNLLTHEYFRIEYAEVWNIAQNLLPELLPIFETLFNSLDEQFGPDTRV